MQNSHEWISKLSRSLRLLPNRGALRAAARVLSVDPSSVSRTVAAVEADLGLRLFQRSTRSLSVTEEGEAYLTRLVPLLEELDHAQDEARAVSRHPAGTVRLTTSVAFAHTCVVPHLADFMSRYPDISLEILPSDANLDLAANSIDLAIRLAPEPAGDLISTKLIDTRYRVVASPEYLAGSAPLSVPTELQNHIVAFGLRCLSFERGGAFDLLARLRLKFQYPATVIIANASITATRRARRSGPGIAGGLVGQRRSRQTGPWWMCFLTLIAPRPNLIPQHGSFTPHVATCHEKCALQSTSCGRLCSRMVEPVRGFRVAAKSEKQAATAASRQYA